MRRTTTKRSSKTSSKKVNVRYKFDTNDDSVLKFKWRLPNDRKMNELNFVNDENGGNTINIKDNH